MNYTYAYQNLTLVDMDGELWKDLLGYEGSYCISNLGRVKSLKREIPVSNKVKPRIIHERILKQNLTIVAESKILTFVVYSHGTRKRFLTARVVYINFVGRFPDHLMMLHKDDDPLNNRPDNLYAVTHQQMSKHYAKLGRIKQPPITPEALEKTREMNCIPVSQYNGEGKFIKSYPSLTEASKQTRIFSQNVGKAINGGKYKRPGGFIWKKGINESDLTEEECTLSRRRLPRQREVVQLDAEGKFVASYDSIAEAARMLNLDSNSLKGSINKSRPYGGYYWKDKL